MSQPTSPSPSPSPSPSSGFRVNVHSKAEGLNISNGSVSQAKKKAIPKSLPQQAQANNRMRRPPLLNSCATNTNSTKPKPNHKKSAVPQFTDPRPHRCVKIEHQDTNNAELLLIEDLKSQVLALKAQLDKALSLNQELQSHNIKLQQDLASALSKPNLPPPHQDSTGEFQSSKFKIANKLENSSDAAVISFPISLPAPPPLPPRPMHLLSKSPSTTSSVPPPPPPPPPMTKAASAPKTPAAVVHFYHSLKRQEEMRDQYKPTMSTAHSSIVGEIQNRSAHLLAIKADVETKGDFINELIKKVVDLAYTDIEQVLKFVDWLDAELSALVDERAVLKHFNWPERKADAIREAAIEYRSLKQLESEISSFKDDTNIPCGTALKKMAILLDKSEQGIERLIKLRNSVVRSYKDWRIPTSWMLDSGMISKIKNASMKLAKMYMRRVITELELGRNSDKESNQEALVLQGVHFAYRAHQFAGGLDSETMCAFEEIRRRAPGHLGGGSPELLAAIASS